MPSPTTVRELILELQTCNPEAKIAVGENSKVAGQSVVLTESIIDVKQVVKSGGRVTVVLLIQNRPSWDIPDDPEKL